ncbi:hypothetical protein ACIRL3_38705 [Streptomyces sp. NPDC102384]|uniref:hypothetical protein n=1 Tax=Streptomyces sp. NPDC102384 TaxID=3366166 RepID=UPI0038079EA0
MIDSVRAAEFAEVMRPRVAELLEARTSVVALCFIERLPLWKEAEPAAPTEMRPEVFNNLRRSGNVFSKVWAASYQLFLGGDNKPPAGPNFSGDPNKREKYKESNRAFWGGWNSVAGQLEAATQPRSGWLCIHSFLVLTPEHLQVFYAPSAQATEYEVGEGAQAGWQIPRSRLSWIRKHHKKEGCFEFGFDDGSWCTLYLPAHEEAMPQIPGILAAGAPTP